MILYDQDFNFIGMSAENLTFLGYEDIDEFTSMHNDFADLFVKREGLIHKFENFSWIHFVLYSGSPNKKAYVRHKNGTEMPVDITIKEVNLTHVYDGLHKIYSVKLINEQFTKISKSDVHDGRSTQSKEFSLSTLTKDLDMPETAAPRQAEPVAASVESDFKLDMPESDFLFKESPSDDIEHAEKAPATPVPAEEDFILNIPPLDEIEREEPVSNHIDFGSPAVSKSSEKPESSLAVEPASNNQLFDFNLLQTEGSPEVPQEETLSPTPAAASSTETPAAYRTEAESEPEKELFDFSLLKREERAEPMQEPAEVATEVESANNASDDSAETQPFSFDLFKKMVPEEEEEQSASGTTNEALIDQIKLDIEEIDADLPTDPQAQKEAEEALHRIVSMQKEEAEAENLPLHVTSAHPQEAAESVNVTIPQTTLHANETAHEPESFEETLQEIFKISGSESSPEQHEKSNSLNIETETLQDKRSITKEPIKSQTDRTAEEKLTLPKLGNLGLSHEEEVDFIEEFLEDTEATISLMESYLKLEDFDNIKYSLIKISSSAEILHFDQLLEEARSLTHHCEAKASDQVAEKLENLKKLTSRYREHFSTIIA